MEIKGYRITGVEARIFNLITENCTEAEKELLQTRFVALLATEECFNMEHVHQEFESSIGENGHNPNVHIVWCNDLSVISTTLQDHTYILNLETN